MSLKTAFRDHLLGDATITGYVGTRIFPFIAPPETALPYIIYSRIQADHDITFTGSSGMTDQLLEVDSYASDALTTESMADAVRERCHGFRGSMGTPTLDVRWMRLVDEDDRLTVANKGSEIVTHRVRQDISIWFIESIPSFP